MKKLKYGIHYCSSYAANYCPENILEENQLRWSSETNLPPQYLILKLDTPALVDTITIGKSNKVHICNLRKLRVFIGMTEACTLEVFETTLKDDAKSETFSLKAVADGKRVPCLYIKLAPLLCWGPSLNLSIWYVEFSGEDDPQIVRPYIESYIKYEEAEVVKLCLKHFRQRGYLSAFNALSEETGVSLEDPSMTELYALVTAGSYQEVEDYMDKALSDGQFVNYIQKQQYKPKWVPLEDVGGPRPGMRGGHQMCVDPYTETVYLLGGWDGNQDMGDFWAYHVPSARWTLLSPDTALDGGPSSRSCHKMVLDPQHRQLFVLGRYVDNQCRAQGVMPSDLYVYDIASSKWTLITEDTAAMGGPQLLFDHQMAFDVLKRTLYVFGGRIITAPWRPAEGESFNNLNDVRLSGLYSYDVATNTWTLLCEDCATRWPELRPLLSRVSHSMLFHPKHRKLYIFGGQRSKNYMHDLMTYDVDSGETVYVVRQGDEQPEGSAPSAAFTQRATLDPDLDEIYVLSGLSKDKEKRDDNVQYSLWVYSIPNKRWTCMHKNEHAGEDYWSKMQYVEPCPRFAHQFIYDSTHKVHYLFGGNPGRSHLPKLRLDDFWKLYLTQPSDRQLMCKFKFLIRKHRFEEQALSDRLGALAYLQTAVYEIIDHDDAEQTKEFHLLTSVLFQAADAARLVTRPVASLRDSLYNKLLEFFPRSMVQPEANLVEALPLCTDNGVCRLYSHGLDSKLMYNPLTS